MSIHVRSNWDGESVPEQRHILAVLAALRQNHSVRGTRWVPAAFAPLTPSDKVMYLAAMLLDICGKIPGKSEIEAATEDLPGHQGDLVAGFLRQVFKQMRKEDE